MVLILYFMDVFVYVAFDESITYISHKTYS